MNTSTFPLETIFGNPPLPPNTYQLHAPGHIETTEDLFQFVYHIYKEGCIMLFGTRGTFDLSNLTPPRQFLMKQYMRSCGIKPKIWVYSKEDIHDVYDQFRHQVSTENIQIEVLLQRRGRYITGVRLCLPVSEEHTDTLLKLRNLIAHHDDYINLLNIKIDVNNLSLFKVSTFVNGNLYVLRFFWE